MEWGSVATSRVVLPDTFSHFVLPDLGTDVVSQPQRSLFYDTLPRKCQIQTVAINNQSKDDWLRYVRHLTDETRRTPEDLDYVNPHLLVVGGNNKNVGAGHLGISTSKAIRSILQHDGDRPTVWAVVDPNDANSVQSLSNKLESGATGIITQPLLSAQAFESLELYSTLVDDYSGVSFVAGLALPKTLRGLLFWESLLDSNLKCDPLFREHCSYFERGGDACQWAVKQQQNLKDFNLVDGVHYMPLKNGKTVMSLLEAV